MGRILGKTSAKVGKGRISRAREMTERQRRFVELKTAWPYPSSARAARLAGYSESVARKADHIISASPAVREALEAWEGTLQHEIEDLYRCKYSQNIRV